MSIEMAGLADIVRQHAAQRPDAAAIVHAGRTTTYAELDRASSRVANGLIAEGIAAAGARRPSRQEQRPLLRAAVRRGQGQRRDGLGQLAARAAGSAAHRQRRRGRDPVRRRGVLSGDREDPRRAEDRRARSWPSAAATAPGSPSPTGATASPPTDPHLPVAPGDTAVQFYTSGTTGLPKGAELTNANFACDAAAVDQDLAAGAGRAQPRLPADVPHRRRRLGHCRPVRRRHQPCRARVRPGARSSQIIERERLQVMLLVPAMILFLVQAPQIRETDLSSLRLIVYGAAPIPGRAAASRRSAIFPCGFQQVYGLTETTGADHPAAARRPRPDRRQEAAVVRLRAGRRRAAHRRRRRRGPADRRRSARSPCARRRSWGATGTCPRRRRRAIQGDWFFTGDAGYLDDKGYLYIHDRVKDMIVSGGENIYPGRGRERAVRPSGRRRRRRDRRARRALGRGGEGGRREEGRTPRSPPAS